MTPDDIEALFHGAAASQGALSDDETAARLRKLGEVLLATRHAWYTNSETLDLIAEKLGDGSRDVSWRVPIGESGLLDFFLSLLSRSGLRQPLKMHSLRLVGNSCADTDENRACVVERNHLGSLVGLLNDDSVLAFVIPVLYNICVDYEPAQLAASQAGLSAALIDLISGPRLENYRPVLGILCKTLSLLVAQEPETRLANPDTPAILLNLATSRTHPPDLEDFCALVSSALAYLASEPLQSRFLETRSFDLLVQAFSDSYSRFDMAAADPDDAAELRQIWSGFVRALADVSALPAFASLYPVGSPAVQRLTNWLSGPASYTHLQTAACLALGNLSRSDEASVAIVKHVFPPLFTILTRAVPSSSASHQQQNPHSSSDQPPSQLLHAILSFLKNLAIPAPNKPLLGALLDPPLSILPTLWTTTDAQPQTQFAAVSLTRLLLSGCPANVRRICDPLSADPSSPARSRSNLHVLIALLARTDAEPTKFEAARAVAAVCRVLHSTPAAQVLDEAWVGGTGGNTSEKSDDDVARRTGFYEAHEYVGHCFAHLVSQTKFPSLRSEAWFVMALMSRSADGADVVVRAVEPFDSCRALLETASGRDMLDNNDLLNEMARGEGSSSSEAAIQQYVQEQFQQQLQRQAEEAAAAAPAAIEEQLTLEPQQVDPAQAAGLARVDRENCLVLLSEMLKNAADSLPPIKKVVFEQIFAKGGQLVLQERAGTS